MSRKRTSAKVGGVQMRLEPLDARVLPDAKVDLNVSGVAATIQPTDVETKHDGHHSEGHHIHDSDPAHAGALLTKIWEHLLKHSAEHSSNYVDMLEFVESDRAFAHEFVILEAGSVNFFAANYITELRDRSENARDTGVGGVEQASAVMVELVRGRDSGGGEKAIASAAATAGAADVASARVEAEAKLASADSRHSSSEPNAASVNALAESQAGNTARLGGERGIVLLTPGRMEDSPVLLPGTKDLPVVPPSYSTLAPTASSESAVMPAVIPLVVSVADVEGTEEAAQPQAEESPDFASQAADLIARYAPFDSATVNENIERFLNSLRESGLPRSSGWNVWKVAVISTAGTMGMLGAEFIRRKRLLTRVPVIRNLSQRLTRTKMA